VLVLYDVEQVHKREHVLVSLVPMVQYALDHLFKHELVIDESLTPTGRVSAHGVHVLQDVVQEHKLEHAVVSLVTHVVQDALDHPDKHELVMEVHV